MTKGDAKGQSTDIPVQHGDSMSDTYSRNPKASKSFGVESAAETTTSEDNGRKHLESYMGQNYHKYRSQMKVSWVLYFKDSAVEAEYAHNLKSSYRFRTTVVGAYLTAFISIIWAVFGSLIRVGKLQLTGGGFEALFNAANGISLICGALLIFSNHIPTMRRHPEMWVYILTMPVSRWFRSDCCAGVLSVDPLADRYFGGCQYSTR